MPTRLRKIRRMRGSRTHGYGRIGQHRDAGSKGYRKVGMHKHRWSIVSNMDEPYFGKHGFTSPQSLRRKVNILNLSILEEIARVEGKTTLNLSEMGYTKLLGTGKISQALTVIVPACSKSAQEKIEAAGGTVNTETPREEKAESEQ